MNSDISGISVLPPPKAPPDPSKRFPIFYDEPFAPYYTDLGPPPTDYNPLDDPMLTRDHRSNLPRVKKKRTREERSSNGPRSKRIREH